MQLASAKPSSLVISILGILFAALFFFLALHVHWSDSELWAVGLAGDFKNYSVDYKPVFNFILNLPFWFPLGNLATIQTDRIIFAGLGLAIAFLVYQLAWLMTEKKAIALWSLFLFVTSTLFLSQGFKVRSDLLACLFQLLALVHFIWLQKKGNRLQRRAFYEWLGLIFYVGMLLTTPKAVFQFFANFVFVWFTLRSQKQRAYADTYLFKNFIIPLYFFMALLFFKHREFATAMDFFIHSYATAPQHPAFWSFKSLEFVGDAVLKNLHLLILLILGFPLFISLKRFPYRKAILLSALASVFLIFFHNDRLPFFIFSLSPLPILLVALASYEIGPLLKKKFPKFVKPIFAVFVFLIMGNASFFIFNMLHQANNDLQIQAQNQMENYLAGHPGTEYYDGTAVLPRNNTLFDFPAPQNKGNNTEIIRTLNRPSLSVVFFSNRMFFYFEEAYQTLENNFFIQVGPGVFARSYVVRSTHLMTDEEWQKVCTALNHPAAVHIYEGSGFVGMNHLKETATCSGSMPAIHSSENFIAYSAYEPLIFPQGLNFAQIFDHKPLY